MSEELHPVESCPGDADSWLRAGIRLNCSNGILGRNRYHCVPNEDKTDLVEFCTQGLIGRIEKGLCLFAYQNRYIDVNDCEQFVSGCPENSYISNEIYNYPACLEINREAGCYLADPDCPPLYRTTLGFTGSSVSPETIIATVTIIVYLLVFIAVGLFFWCRRRRRRRNQENARKEWHVKSNSGEESVSLESTNEKTNDYPSAIESTNEKTNDHRFAIESTNEKTNDHPSESAKECTPSRRPVDVDHLVNPTTQSENSDIHEKKNDGNKDVRQATNHNDNISGTDWVDPEDPTVIAESELLTAAKSIEAAAQKLSQLKPRKQAKEADMSLNFEEQILEAAKSTASATAALVKSASAAQQELVTQGKIGATYHKSQILDDDGQWSEGLISAAKMVAAMTHSICESVEAMVQGHATVERLIASAKEVAGSTAHLLVAYRVKDNPDSVAMKRLQAAGNAVKQATEVLVKAAQQAKQRDKDDVDVALDSRKVGGIKQEIQIQQERLRKEIEWIEAREKLAKFRKQRYKETPQDSDSSSAF